jgi:type IV pilus assembly protein PilM
MCIAELASRRSGESVFRKPKTVVGLDIGSSAVKAVQLKAVGRGYRVAAYGSESVPPDAIVDGAIIDSEP